MHPLDYHQLQLLLNATMMVMMVSLLIVVTLLATVNGAIVKDDASGTSYKIFRYTGYKNGSSIRKLEAGGIRGHSLEEVQTQFLELPCLDEGQEPCQQAGYAGCCHACSVNQDRCCLAPGKKYDLAIN